MPDFQISLNEMSEIEKIKNGWIIAQCQPGLIVHSLNLNFLLFPSNGSNTLRSMNCTFTDLLLFVKVTIQWVPLNVIMDYVIS